MKDFAEMGKISAQNAFAVSCGLLSDLGALQMGVRLPVVQPFGLYMHREHAIHMFPNPFAVLNSNTALYDRTVVVPRSGLTMTTPFLNVLRQFVDAAVPQFPL